MVEIAKETGHINQSINKILSGICSVEHVFNEVEDLFDAGILDSFGVISMIALLEKEFEIQIPSTALTMDNFKAVNRIVRLVERLETNSVSS